MSDGADLECPTCGADHLDSWKKIKIHHYQSHGERLVETSTCDHCGEEFEPTNKGIYCSIECRAAANRDRVSFECEYCGDTFEVHQYRADEARFCSHECRGAASRKQATVECEQCGDSFEVQANISDDRRFCSLQCSARYRRNRVRLECEQCGRPFHEHKCFDEVRKYCCHACQYEAARETPREFETVDDLLHQLYVDEDWNYTKTFRRQRAVLGDEDALLKKEVREHLIEMGVYRLGHQRSLTETDPDEVGGPTPDGDSSWREYYGGESADD
ncbi:SAM domain-containing protein [Natrinema thermotolerans]|uniref:SAM domain-containing protein n=1 Tax=Natrinema thermotolerans TaxID=121872 RepID=UPI00067892CB|nr:SAM domain-containing protein [Natrinema thermotolerans]QCC57345.1 hypothetical protein DVR14_01300 [Natrinema thermotolerans]